MIKVKASVLDRLKLVKNMSLPSKSDVLSAIARSAGRIPFADDVVAMWFCAKDPSTPSKVRVGIVGALAYLVFPIDSIPDIVVGLGFSDDVTVLAAVLAMVASHIKPEHKEKAKAALSGKGDEPSEDMPIRPVS